MTWWQKTLQIAGGSAIVIALCSYVLGVEGRISTVEQQEKTNTELLKSINDNMVTKDYLDAKLESVVKK